MGDLLFSPHGRIAARRFWQGLVILTVATVIVTAASAMIHPFFSLAHLALVAPYVSVFAKRLHDIGATGWFAVPIWFASIVIGMILVALFGGILVDPAAVAIQEDLFRRMQAGDNAGMMEGLKRLGAMTLSMNILSAVATNGILGAALGLLPSQPQKNKHGPVPSGGGRGFE